MLNVAIKIGIQLAMAAASMAITASQKFEGQRLSDTSVNLADYGAPLPRFWGVSRFDGCPIIFAEKLKEKKVTHKTKGGKYTEYKYYGTWAVAIADHEIDAVSGIYLDRHLCYQSKSAGPLTPVLGGLSSILNGNTEAPPVKLALGRNLRIYLGTEDQEPDPRYEAWCEDRYGAPDLAPAFKGVAYAIFIDIPLEKLGNHLPQTSIEATNNKASAYPYEVAAHPLVVDSRTRFSTDYKRLHNIDINDAIIVWDVPTRTRLMTFASNVGGAIGPSPSVLYGRGSDGLLAINPDGGETVLTTVFDFAGSDVFYVGGLICLTPVGGLLPVTHYYSGDPDIGVIATARSFIPDHYFEDMDGNAWAVGQVPGQNKAGFVQMPDGAEHLVDTADDAAAYAMCNEDGKFLTWQAGKLFLVDPATWTAGTPTSAPLFATTPEVPFRNIQPGTTSIWLHASEYRASDASLIRTVTLSNWDPSVSGEVLYDPINHALITGIGGNAGWLYLDRVSSAGVALSVIVSDVMGWAGVTNFDAVALDQLVKGYSVVQGTAREMIEPLLTAHFASARPHDFTLQFIKLGGAPTGTVIETEDFASLGGAPRFARQESPDKALPRKVTVNYSDPAKDYQTNNVISDRGSDEVASVSDKTIDMTTYVATPDEMRPLADRYFRQLWIERETVTCALTPQELRIEPGDVRQIALDGKVRTVRAEKVTFTAGALRIEWKRTHPSLATLSNAPGAQLDGSDADTIYVAGPTKGIAVDIPLAADAHDSTLPQIYYGAGKYLASAAWPGATFFKGDATGENYTDITEVSAANGMTWGYTTNVLGTADPWLWDRGNSVNIDVRGGSLSSVTEADIEADPSVNLAYIGGELVNFTSATLEGDGTYTLSGFKRGRRGTEWAVADHTTNEEFVLAADLARLGVGLSEVGATEYFKAATLGSDYDGAPQISFPFSGATLKPYAPARVIWTTDGTDLFGEIIRRTRVGGSWTDSGVVPLSENSEDYEVDVLAGGSVVRTITVSGANTFTYTAAQLAADGFSLTNRPSVNVYQMSDAVGRGFALAA